MKTDFKLLDIITLKKVASIFSGNYRTAFKWAWMEFEDIRIYEYWDDIKNIDWLITAKNNKVYVKKFIEERELPILFVFNVASTMQFGIWEKTKLDTMIESFLLLGLSWVKNNDSIWALFYSDIINNKLESKKWMPNLFRIYKQILDFKINKTINKWNINIVINHLFKQKIKNNIIFIFSDELNIDEKVKLKALSKKNDIVYISIHDNFENNISGKWIFNIFYKSNLAINTRLNKDKYIKNRQEQFSEFKHLLNSSLINNISITNTSQIFKEFYNFFKLRQKL